jgi:hypothetical protein
MESPECLDHKPCWEEKATKGSWLLPYKAWSELEDLEWNAGLASNKIFSRSRSFQEIKKPLRARLGGSKN